MSQKKIRYSDFVDRLDVEAIEEELGFEVLDTDHNGNHIGYCFDVWGLHKHGDTTGKFAIHPEKKVYNCFVCGGGSLLSLVMELKDFDVDEATDWLYEFSGQDRRTDSEFIHEFLQKFYDEKPNKPVLPYFNVNVLQRFNEKTDWFEERGISQAVVEQYKLGYSSLLRRSPPKKEKYADEEDYYGPAAVFPHFFKGKLVGWQNRWLDDRRPKWIAKYTNTFDFPREETLFNYDLARKTNGPVIVVESVPTVLFLESLGFAAVGTFGANVTDTQLRLLRSFQSGLVLSPDADDAGGKWTRDLSEYLVDYVPVRLMDEVSDEPGADLGDLAKEDNAKEMVECMLEDAMHVSIDTFYMN